MQLVAATLKRMTGGKAKNVTLKKADGGRRMVISVGRVQGDITLDAEEIREIEKLMGASRRKREALMAWLRRKSKKLVATGVRELLVEMDREFLEWYEVVDMEVEENVEDKPPAPGADPAPEHRPEAQAPAPEPPAPDPPAPEPPVSDPPAPEPPAARSQAPPQRPAAGRSKRGAAEEANRTMEESFEKGDLSFSREENKAFKKPSRKRKASLERREKQTEGKKKRRRMNETGEKKKRKKKKKMKTVIVVKPLVYITNMPAFLEMVRVARGLSVEETMVRIGIDAGQGSLKVVANVFSK